MTQVLLELKDVQKLACITNKDPNSTFHKKEATFLDTPCCYLDFFSRAVFSLNLALNRVSACF